MRCLNQHCRRFVRKGEDYCLPPRLCLIIQQQRDTFANGMRQALRMAVESRW